MQHCSLSFINPLLGDIYFAAFSATAETDTAAINPQCMNKLCIFIYEYVSTFEYVISVKCLSLSMYICEYVYFQFVHKTLYLRTTFKLKTSQSSSLAC